VILTRNYELALIFRPNLTPEEYEQISSKIKDLIVSSGGEFIKEDKWGKRKLVYPIEKEKEGFYHFFSYSHDPQKLLELKRQLKLLPEVLRFMIVRE